MYALLRAFWQADGRGLAAVSKAVLGDLTLHLARRDSAFIDLTTSARHAKSGVPIFPWLSARESVL
jgi:hypothetical protein